MKWEVTELKRVPRIVLAPVACPKSSFHPGNGDGLLPTTCEYIFRRLIWSNTAVDLRASGVRQLASHGVFFFCA